MQAGTHTPHRTIESLQGSNVFDTVRERIVLQYNSFVENFGVDPNPHALQACASTELAYSP